MKLIIVIGVLLFIAIIILFVIGIKAEKKIYESGIEAESVVSRCESYFNSDNDTRYNSYVKYIGDDGNEHEGLLNVSTNLPIGRQVRIKYIPGKYTQVVFVSQKID